MSVAGSIALASVCAYLTGAVPFGLLIARYGHGVDVRRHGSGNIGATNIGRVLGKKWGILCLVLDFAKGLVPALLYPMLFPVPTELQSAAAVACGAAAIAGHVFPVWLGFRGGKGVATGAGVAAVLSPVAAASALAAFAVLFAVKRVVSLSSITAAIVYGIVALVIIGKPFTTATWPLSLFAVAVPTLIVTRHRDNIRRLIRGEEKSYVGNQETDDRRPDPDGDSPAVG